MMAAAAAALQAELNGLETVRGKGGCGGGWLVCCGVRGWDQPPNSHGGPQALTCTPAQAVSINVAGGIPPHEAAVDAATAEWVASSPTAWPVPGQHARVGSFAFRQHPSSLSRSAPS